MLILATLLAVASMAVQSTPASPRQSSAPAGEVLYVQMELDEGALPHGQRYIAKDRLLARRAPQVSIGQDVTYGMGLMVDKAYGTPIVHHGGDLTGTISFVTITPGMIGLEFVVGDGPSPMLIVRDAQHEYVFAATS